MAANPVPIEAASLTLKDLQGSIHPTSNSPTNSEHLGTMKSKLKTLNKIVHQKKLRSTNRVSQKKKKYIYIYIFDHVRCRYLDIFSLLETLG